MDKFILGAHFVLKDKTAARSMCEYRHFPSKAKSIKVKTRRLVRETTGDTTSLQEELSSLPEIIRERYVYKTARLEIKG